MGRSRGGRGEGVGGGSGGRRGGGGGEGGGGKIGDRRMTADFFFTRVSTDFQSDLTIFPVKMREGWKMVVDDDKARQLCNGN